MRIDFLQKCFSEEQNNGEELKFLENDLFIVQNHFLYNINDPNELNRLYGSLTMDVKRALIKPIIIRLLAKVHFRLKRLPFGLQIHQIYRPMRCIELKIWLFSPQNIAFYLRKALSQEVY